MKRYGRTFEMTSLNEPMLMCVVFPLPCRNSAPTTPSARASGGTPRTRARPRRPPRPPHQDRRPLPGPSDGCLAESQSEGDATRSAQTAVPSPARVASGTAASARRGTRAASPPARMPIRPRSTPAAAKASRTLVRSSPASHVRAGVRVGAHGLDERHLARLVEVPRLVDEEDRLSFERQKEKRARAREDVNVPREVANRIGVHLGRAIDEQGVEPLRWTSPRGRAGAAPAAPRPVASEPCHGTSRPPPEVQGRAHGGLRLKVTSFISVISSIA